MSTEPGAGPALPDHGAAPVIEVPWRRQSPLLFAIEGWDVVRRTFLQLLLPLWVASDSDMPTAFRAGLVVLAVMPLVPVLWVWFVHRYRLVGDAIEVRTGLIVRRRTLLPLGRVQAADRTAGVLQRVFGLARLQLKSGAAGTQVDFKALAPAEVDRLLAAVDAARTGAPPEPGAEARAEAGASADGVAPGAPSSGRREGPRLDMRRLLVLGATSGRGLALLAAAFYFGVESLDSFVADDAGKTLFESSASLLKVGGWALGALVALLGSVVVAFLSVLEVAVRLGDFRVHATARDLVVSRGLLERKTVTLPIKRIQAVRVIETLPMWLLGYAAIDAYVIGHSEDKGAATRIHPALRRGEVEGFLTELLPGFDARGAAIRPPARAQLRFVIRPLILPTLLLTGLGVALFATELPGRWLAMSAVALGLWTGARVALARRVWRETGVELAGDWAVVQGWSEGRSRLVVPRRCVQEAWLQSSPLQRRRDLVSACVRVASGAEVHVFVARELDPHAAGRLLDWLEGRPLRSASAVARR
jgi:putative membrane protein